MSPSQMLEVMIGILHTVWTIFIGLYAFLITSHYHPIWDKYYMVYILLLVTSWLLFKDECLVTYAYKLWLDPTYPMGRDGNDLKDAEVIFGKKVAQTGINIVVLFTIISIALVSLRRHYSPFVWVPFLTMLVMYLLGLRQFFAPAFYQTWLKPWNHAFRITFLMVTFLFLIYLQQKKIIS
jgi:hypothetical protein